MTGSSPSPETIRFIARILAAQPTSVTDVAETIANIVRTVDNLGAPAAKPEAAPVPKALAAKTAAVEIATQDEAEPDADAALAPKITVLKPRGERVAVTRTRRRIVEEIEEPVVETAPEPVAQPRLLRRAEIVQPEGDPAAALQPVRPAGGPVRGVVKWFDGKTGKGALRLTGVSGDVPLERAVLEQSAIKRLYKDQEIEATIRDLGRGRVTLLSLSLPGRNPAVAAANALGGGDGTTMVRRQARSILVEVKRDGVRATSAREEAEQVLGGMERLRHTRRMTPSK
jgi:cold shock CspA family protein